MILPAQFANTVREGENINFCPYCSRILFYEETGEEEVYDFSFDQAGSLADLDDDLNESDGYDDDEERDEDSYEDSEERLDEDEENFDEDDEDNENSRENSSEEDDE